VNKFKIGDMVTIPEGAFDKLLEDVVVRWDFNGGWMAGMVGYVGKIGRVTEARKDWVRVEGFGRWVYDVRYLELAVKARYQIGDLVLVRKDAFLGEDGQYVKDIGDVGIVPDMFHMEGKSATIMSVVERDDGAFAYRFRRAGFVYPEKCLRRLRKAAVAAPAAVELPMPAKIVEPPPAPPKAKAIIDIPVARHAVALALQEEVAAKGSGVCTYSKLFADGTVKNQHQDLCHARIPDDTRKDIVALVLNISGHAKAAPNADAYKSFVDYILKDSPWSSVFLPGQSFESGVASAVYVDVERSVAEVASAAIALRIGSEFATECRVFKLVRDAGFSGDVAHILLNFLTFSGGELVTRECSNWHHVLCPEQKAQEVWEFYGGRGFKIEDDRKVPYRTNHGYYGTLRELIAEYSDKNLSRFFKDAFKVKLAVGRWDEAPVTLVSYELLLEVGAVLEKLINKKELK
jgi:hypothetical protein